jgi:DNA-binding NarL/FixJ family response regulator
VKVYLHAIFDKLQVENRTELALRAGELVRR